MMRHAKLLPFILLIILCLQCQNVVLSKDAVTVDFGMAERAVDWLDIINTGADDKAVKDYFMKNVASTKGCMSIIKHWSRFMEWDNDRFYDFIMEAMGRIPTDRPLENEDGSLTSLGKRRMLWTAALADPGRLRSDIARLKEINLVDTAKVLARMYLPYKARIDNSFYFVLFGGSNAFSIGKENGFDILQMNKNADGSIDVEDVILILAHEMHHSGFASCNKNGGDKMLLLGVLAAEGMPTYFINHTRDKIEQYRVGHDKILRDLAAQWERHLARMPRIYEEAEKDIELNLDGKLDQEEIWGRWMEGLQGQAYALGSDMFSVIDKYLGVDSAKIVAEDTRQFLRLYNKAAQTGNLQGGHYYIFGEGLAARVSDF